MQKEEVRVDGRAGGSAVPMPGGKGPHILRICFHQGMGGAW